MGIETPLETIHQGNRLRWKINPFLQSGNWTDIYIHRSQASFSPTWDFIQGEI